MFARLVRTPKALTGGVALAAGLLCWVPVSQAAVFAGSATDPAGDLGLDIGDALPSPPVDFTHVSVVYDDMAGRVDVSFTFNQAPASSEQLEASVALGFVEPDGSCSTPSWSSRIWHGPIEGGAPRGQAVVRGVSLGFTGSVGGWVYSPDPGDFGYVEEGWEGTALFDWPGTQQETWNFATTHPLLVGKHYRCVRAALALFNNPGNTGWGTDYLDSDVFALQPAVVAAPPLPPPPGTEPSPGVVPSGPTGTPAPLFTRQKARRALKRALAHRYAKAFRKRKGYTATCLKTSPSRWNCSVRWRYGQLIYEGKVKLTRRANGRVASQFLLRKTIK